MLSMMSITQHSAYRGCLQAEARAALRLAMGKLESLRPTHCFVGYALAEAQPVRLISAIELEADAITPDQRRNDRAEGDKHKYSFNILSWLNLITNNWSSETRWKPSLL